MTFRIKKFVSIKCSLIFFLKEITHYLDAEINIYFVSRNKYDSRIIKFNVLLRNASISSSDYKNDSLKKFGQNFVVQYK